MRERTRAGSAYYGLPRSTRVNRRMERSSASGKMEGACRAAHGLLRACGCFAWLLCVWLLRVRTAWRAHCLARALLGARAAWRARCLARALLSVRDSPLEDHQPDRSVSTESHTACIFSSGSLKLEMRSCSRMRFSSS